jgi:hypothetical protein
MKHKILGLLVGGLALAATASPASAANVSIEVEGLNVAVAPTIVDTPATVTKNGQSCSGGDNVLGALDVLTKGDWDGSTSGATRILAEDHPFISGDAGWVFTINGRATSAFGCGATLHDGDKLLWYASAGFGIYHVDKGFDDPVLLDAPATAVAGQPFTVTATDTDTTYDDAGTPTSTRFTRSAGATITGGTFPVDTGGDGTAPVTVAGGPYTLVVTKAKRAPARITGCATNGSDGFCGTTAGTPPPGGTPRCPGVTGVTGLCVPPAPTGLTGVTEGKAYKKGQGPRELKGHVNAPAAGLKDVRVRLTRNDKGRCSTFDGKKEAFVKLKRCGATRGSWFSVGAKQDFTYLLPAKLGRGRYVLDLDVTGADGKSSTRLARGTTRVVFTVA